MEKVYYFKTREEIIRYGTSSNEIFEDDPQCIPISEEEYNEAITEMDKKIAEYEKLAFDEISAEEFMSLIEEAF